MTIDIKRIFGYLGFDKMPEAENLHGYYRIRNTDVRGVGKTVGLLIKISPVLNRRPALCTKYGVSRV